jgi:serine/threonine protein kinase
VHGEVKPSNILVRTDDGCCLADVGLADVGLADVGLADVGLADVGLADVGLAGTHAYVPPAASPDFAPPERRYAVATAEPPDPPRPQLIVRTRQLLPADRRLTALTVTALTVTASGVVAACQTRDSSLIPQQVALW